MLRMLMTLAKVSAIVEEKMDKIKELLEKKKVSVLMGVNKLKGLDKVKLDDYQTSLSEKATQDHLEPKASNPSASVEHSCIKSPSCNEEWGLLGCIELYKLETAKERHAFCKENDCCNRWGTPTQPGDFSPLSKGASRIWHKCNFML